MRIGNGIALIVRFRRPRPPAILCDAEHRRFERRREPSLLLYHSVLVIADNGAVAHIAFVRRPCVYILRCADGLYYTGATTNLEQRLRQHEAGSVDSFTCSRLPVKLVFVMEFPTMYEALNAERKVKDWSRSKKEALIRQDIATLRLLAECRNQSHCRRIR